MPWYRGDFHVHSRRSTGGELTPAEMVAEARAAGLDFLAVTEHDSAGGHGDWTGITVIPGVEVVTRTGHWLALGPRVGPGTGMAEVRRAGGLSVAAHPHAPYPGGTFEHPYEQVDAVEVWNGRWRSGLPWQADNEAALAGWARTLSRPAVGNSDAHRRGQIGTPQTVVRAGALTPAALLEAVRRGRCWIAGSAAVDLTFTARAGDRVAHVGDRLRTGGDPVAVDVAVSGVPGAEISVRTDDSTYVRVEVRHPDGGMAALTNPIHLG